MDRLSRLLAGMAAAIAMLIGSPALAQTANLIGGPPIAKFVPNIGTPPSSLDIAEDDTSMVYIANAAGVLTFDGELWRILPLPNGDVVNALRFDGKSRMYVGGHSIFGYLERDAAGDPQFHDLTPIFTPLLKGEPFGGIYLIRVTDDGIFFEGTKHIFQYLPGSNTGRMWMHPGRLGAMEMIHGELWMQFRGEGLRRFHDGKWLPIAGTENLSLLTNALLPLPNGGVLSMSADGQWRQFVDGVSGSYKMPKGMPGSSAFNSARVLKDGSFALAGVNGAIWLYNPVNADFRSMQISEGPIVEMRVANDGGILALTDLAVYHVGWPNDWTAMSFSNGISGAIHRIRRWGDRWIALSNNGVYTTRTNNDVLRHLPYTDYDGYDLMPADQHHAYLAENFKLLWVDENQVVKSLGRADLYPRVLVRSDSHPDQMYVGTEYGVALFSQTATGGQFRIDRGAVEETVRDVVELSPTKVLLGTARNGIRLVTFDDNRTRVIDDRMLGNSEGISYGQIANAAVSKIDDGSIIASTATGVFRFVDGHFQAATFTGMNLPADGTAPVLRFASDPPGCGPLARRTSITATAVEIGSKTKSAAFCRATSNRLPSMAIASPCSGAPTRS